MKTLSTRKKNAYLFVLQYLPVLGTLLIMIHYILILMGIRTIIIDYIADASLFAWISTYASSQMFFCKLHRAFVIYIGIASLDVDLHHWTSFRLIHPEWIVPVFMIATALTLLFHVIHRKFCKDEE